MVVIFTYDAGSRSAMVAAAGVMMTGAADVEAAAAMEVAALADSLQAAGQRGTLLPIDWTWQAALFWRTSCYCLVGLQSSSTVLFLQGLSASVCWQTTPGWDRCAAACAGTPRQAPTWLTRCCVRSSRLSQVQRLGPLCELPSLLFADTHASARFYCVVVDHSSMC